MGILPREWNYTHLCLIPKIPDPMSISDLRPISLCSVIYKVVSKIMTKRLAPILQEIISPSQSAFVAERLMTDNITIAHEMLHSIGDSQDPNSAKMVVKTDMSKAYDRVEWGYLRSLLCALGFDHKWVNWVLKCISSVTYSVLINDQPHGMIIPHRGLRQGDPLSPALFVLCSEGLAHLMSKADHSGSISGIQFGMGGPSVNQLFFADDCLFACDASEEQSAHLIRNLKRYESVTGQVLNPLKSSIMFGRRVLDSDKIKVKQKLGIHHEGGEGKYLGLPESMQGSKVKLFSYLKERLSSKISGWHAKTLSQGGKEVMLKAVASAIPVLPMSVYRLPKTVISSIHGLMANFWWDSVDYKRKIHWISWEKLCLPKEQGGMGFKNMEFFNQALLAKQAWRLLNVEDCLMTRVLRGKYLGAVSLLTTQQGNHQSYAWKSLLHGRDLLVQGLRRLVGNGRNIHVWTEPWLQDETGVCRTPLRRQRCFDVNLRVSDLIDFRRRKWNTQLLQELFVPGDVQLLLQNQPVTSVKDSWVWKHQCTGIYTVKTGYELAMSVNMTNVINGQLQLPSLNPLKAQVWKCKAPTKIRVFMWKALSGALSVFDALTSRGMRCEPVCQICGLDGESINHILFSCTLARKVWAISGFPHPRGGFDALSVYANVNYLLTVWTSNSDLRSSTQSFPWILWYLWKNRNSLLFEGVVFDGEQICSKAIEEAQVWSAAQARRPDEGAGFQRTSERRNTIWTVPPSNFVKCNIGIKWSKAKQELGVAWILRNTDGFALFHSRRSFARIWSKQEAHFISLAWAVESMLSFKCPKVYFALEGGMLVNAIDRPAAWPSFKYKVQELRCLLGNLMEWKLVVEVGAVNRDARLIATSVLTGNRFHSYVVRGYSRWLSSDFW